MQPIRSVFTTLPLSFSENDGGMKQWEHLVDSLTKQLKKEKRMDINRFCEETGYQQLRIEQETDTTIIEALQRLTSVVDGEVLPVRVFVEKGDFVTAGHSLIGAEFTKKTHRTLHLVGETYRHIWDMHRLLAETYALNEFEHFVRTNTELVQYLVARHIAQTLGKKNVTLLPYDGKFSFDLCKHLKRFGWLKETVQQSEQVDAYKTLFYLPKSKEGYVTPIAHPLLQEILVPEFMQQMLRAKEKKAQEKAAIHHYSASFQTKKGIRKKTENVMNDNAFLTHYGLVEIDNNVPLETFSLWEEAFITLSETLNIPTAQDHSLRIRRLGKQKATGMYYPMFRATVLDVDSPDSYGHELGHQLDYTLLGNEKTVSKTLSFRPILDLYEQVTEKQVLELGESHPFMRQWHGKGKYSKQYYLQPTEVFARSFELYLREKGVRSRLLKQDLTDVTYPQDEAYLEKIISFFDELMKNYQNDLLPVLY